MVDLIVNNMMSSVRYTLSTKHCFLDGAQNQPGGVKDVLAVGLADHAVDDGVADVVQRVDVIQTLGKIQCYAYKESCVGHGRETRDAYAADTLAL